MIGRALRLKRAADGERPPAMSETRSADTRTHCGQHHQGRATVAIRSVLECMPRISRRAIMSAPWQLIEAIKPPTGLCRG